VIVYLDDKRRDFAQIVTKIQHATAGIPLLLLGLEKLSHGDELAIAIAEIVIAILVLGTFVLELRATVKHHKHGASHAYHPKVGWFDLAAGVLLIYEAFHTAHGHKPGYLRPQFFSGVFVIVIGLLHAKIAHAAGKRRYLKVDDDGVEYKVVLRGWSIAWADLASITLSDDHVVFVTTAGRRHTVNLRRFHNHDAVRRALADHPASVKLLDA
jgi:hypothetical protein